MTPISLFHLRCIEIEIHQQLEGLGFAVVPELRPLEGLGFAVVPELRPLEGLDSSYRSQNSASLSFLSESLSSLS